MSYQFGRLRSYQFGRLSRDNRSALYLAVVRMLDYVDATADTAQYEAQSGGEAVLEALLPLIERDRCECSDGGCKLDHGLIPRCPYKATQTVRRTDMEDGETTFRFCDGCTADAMESGVFA